MEQVVSLILGAVASWLQGNKGQGFTSNQRFMVSIAAAIAAGGLSTLFNVYQNDGAFLADTEAVLGSIGAAFLAAQANYRVFFKKKKDVSISPK